MESLLSYTATFPAFFMMFFFVYLLSYFIPFRNWPRIHRSEASSCTISLFHGTPAVAMALYALLETQAPSTFAAVNTAFENTVLEFSIAYFLLDLLHYIVFFPNDILFILHHLATLYVFVTSRYVVYRGATEILVLLVLAEVTSVCQNAWSLSGYRKAEVPAAAELYEFLSPRFYALYSIARGILGPLFVFKIGLSYLSGAADDLIPRWVWLSWIAVIVTANMVSILWVWDNWMTWYSERLRKVA